jgi:hypothetical protein
MVDIQTISIIVPSISLTLAAIWYILNIKINNRARQAMILSSLQSRIDTTDFWERYIEILWVYKKMSYEEYKKKVLQSKEKSAQVMSVISTFYHIGWLVKMKLLDIDAVMGFTFDVVAVYDVVIPHLVRHGEEPGTPYNPGHYPHFTYLYDEIKKRREKLKIINNK